VVVSSILFIFIPKVGEDDEPNLTIAQILTRWGLSLVQPPANEKVRYLFIDKIHTLKQHRDDVVTAATRRMME